LNPSTMERSILLVPALFCLTLALGMKTAHSSISDWAVERLMDRQRLPPSLRNSIRPLISNEIPNEKIHLKMQSAMQGQPQMAADVPSQQQQFMQMLPYPTYSVPPQTSFSCSNVKQAGFYADTETGCQVIRRCTLYNFMFTYICPNRTLFRQDIQSCDYWYNVQCPRSLQQMEDSVPQFPSQRFPSSSSNVVSKRGLSILDRSIPLLQPFESADAPPFSEDLDWTNEASSPQNNPPAKGSPVFRPEISQRNSSIRTLMQWVGENPIWVPREEQVQLMSRQLSSPLMTHQPEDKRIKRRKSLAISSGGVVETDANDRINRNRQLMFMKEGANLPTTTPSSATTTTTTRTGMMPTTMRPAAMVTSFSGRTRSTTTTTTLPASISPLAMVSNALLPLPALAVPKNKLLGTGWIPLTDFG
ncbi:hypothetical protein BV898_11908, partial [Hypsibius exemplaris]